MTATCRAAWLQILVIFADGSNTTIASSPGLPFMVSPLCPLLLKEKEKNKQTKTKKQKSW
jgi:hypothetical protein